MTLAQSFNATKIAPADAIAAAESVAVKIRERCQPSEILLFGSAANGTFKFGSDLDFILIFKDLESCKLARKLVRQDGKLHSTIPVDLLFTTQENFQSLGANGGVFYTAKHEGIKL